MIPDSKVNQVYVSDLLPQKYPALYKEIDTILRENKIPLVQLRGTRDIWCRDYMPIQTAPRKFVQFRYTPDYLKGHEHTITPTPNCYPDHLDKVRESKVVVDGGNIVAGTKQFILTDKVFQENPRLTPSRVISILEDILQAEAIVIPQEPYDWVGHSDGVVRFLTDSIVLINEYPRWEFRYPQKVERILVRKQLGVVRIPYSYQDCIPQGVLASAVGNYINYLRVGDVIILPAYKSPKDKKARAVLEKALPTAKIYPVDAVKLAQQGGVFNCITWGVQGDPKCQTNTEFAPRASSKSLRTA